MPSRGHDAVAQRSLGDLPAEPFDAVVVGAGPAGSAAALHLARRGRRVLLLDRASFPRDKVCGDGLTPHALTCLGRAGLLGQVLREGFRCAGATAYSPSRIAFDVPGTYVTLRRARLDEILATGAARAGAVFARGEARALAVAGDGSVSLDARGAREAVRARVAVVATGARVAFARAAGLVDRVAPTSVSARCIVRSGAGLDRIVVSSDRAIRPAYGWVFPLGDGWFNAGVILDRGRWGPGRRGLAATFRTFVRRFPVARAVFSAAREVTPLRAAMLRCGLRGARALGAGNVLAVGEALGATVPLVGAGVGDALYTGERAAGFVDRFLRSGDRADLQAYASFIEEERRPLYRGFEAGEFWLSLPWLNDVFARRMRAGGSFERAFRRIVARTSNPKDLFSLRAVLGKLW